jgi:hypothetical protein
MALIGFIICLFLCGAGLFITIITFAIPGAFGTSKYDWVIPAIITTGLIWFTWANASITITLNN